MNTLPETRGAKTKYDFSDLDIGEIREFKKAKTRNVYNSFYAYCERKNLKWTATLRQVDKSVFLQRTK